MRFNRNLVRLPAYWTDLTLRKYFASGFCIMVLRSIVPELGLVCQPQLAGDKNTGVNYQRCLGKRLGFRGWSGLHWVMAAIVDWSSCLFQIESIGNCSSLSLSYGLGPSMSSGSGAGTMLLQPQTLSIMMQLKDKIGEWMTRTMMSNSACMFDHWETLTLGCLNSAHSDNANPDPVNPKPRKSKVQS
jgi:hypothetical protein